jgi:hypothetical protein
LPISTHNSGDERSGRQSVANRQGFYPSFWFTPFDTTYFNSQAIADGPVVGASPAIDADKPNDFALPSHPFWSDRNRPDRVRESRREKGGR